MKKLFYMGMGLLLCLSATLWTGCDEKPLDETGGGSGGGTTEQRGNLEGVVTDKATGVGIARASVTLQPGDLNELTDEKGAFSFLDIQAGSYKLQVSKNGYVDCADDIEVKANGTVRKTVGMETQDLQVLDTNGKVAVSVLTFDRGEVKSGFIIKNTGNSIVEWDIPTLADDWISFNKRSGKLAPGASEKIVLTVDAALAFGADKDATVYIGSTAGDFRLNVRVLGAMVKVAGGTFMMGATEEQVIEGELEIFLEDAYPVHEVTLDGFSICKYEVTQAQWEAVMGTTVEQQRVKANASSLYGVGDDYPMYYVNRTEAVQFCDKLSEKTGKKFRLPTEAEWEYAARGGQHHDGTRYAGSDDLSEVAWWRNESTAYRVGSKKPNGLGIYDMSGNVWEWCSDWYGSYSSSSSVNPQGPSSGSYCVYRGGAWSGSLYDCRVSVRGSGVPGRVGNFLGFRVVCEL